MFLIIPQIKRPCIAFSQPWPDLSVYKNSYSVHFLPIQHAGAHDGAQIGIGGGGGGGGSIIGGGGAVQHGCGHILIQ